MFLYHGFVISLGVGRGRDIRMSQKIVCKGRKYDVIVDCSKIQRNIFKILKLLNDIGSVYLFSDPESKEF